MAAKRKSTQPEKIKISHRWHHRIPPNEIQTGDFICYFDNGERWRRVKAVTRRGIRTEPLKYRKLTVARSRSVSIDRIRSAWTKRKG